MDRGDDDRTEVQPEQRRPAPGHERHESEGTEARSRPREGERKSGQPRDAIERPTTTADDVARLRAREGGDRTDASRESYDRLHRANWAEFRAKAIEAKLDFDEPERRMVQVDRIARLEVNAPGLDTNDPKFWEHHEAGPEQHEYYRKMADSYPRLEARLAVEPTPEARQKMLDRLKNDSELGPTARFWYDRPIKLYEYRGSYFCEEGGRHRTVLAHKYELDRVPAEVQAAHEPER